MRPKIASTPDELEYLHKRLLHCTRQLWDIQKERISAGNRLAAMERDEIQLEDLQGAQEVLEGLEKLEHGIDLQILYLSRQHPLAGWIKSQRGIGLATFANLLGVAGDIGRFETVSKLWKYLGLHVTPGGTAPRKVKGQSWTHTDCKHQHMATCPSTCTTNHHPNCAPGVLGTAYSPKGRTICYMLGEAIVKVGGDGPYRAAYDAKKAYYEGQREDWPQIRRHKAAMRYAVKCLIRDLWQEWMRILKPERLEEREARERERAANQFVISKGEVPSTPTLDIEQEQAASEALMPTPPVSPASTTDFERIKSCQNKRQHSNEAAARAAVVRMRCDGILDDLSVYQCRYCDRWHVGHTPRQRRSQKAG